METLSEIEQLEFELAALLKVQESLKSRLVFLKQQSEKKITLRKNRLRKKEFVHINRVRS